LLLDPRGLTISMLRIVQLRRSHQPICAWVGSNAAKSSNFSVLFIKLIQLRFDVAEEFLHQPGAGWGSYPQPSALARRSITQIAQEGFDLS
jgi:hypothetical protein